MTPPDPHVCGGCFFFETTRGVCPTARDAYGLETPAVIQQRAEALRAAITEDAHAARSLFDLIQKDAQERGAVVSAMTDPLTLPPAPETPLPNTTMKEDSNAPARQNP
jgi:hypothetical protein